MGKPTYVRVQLLGLLRFNPDGLESFLSQLLDEQNCAAKFRHDSCLREETFKPLEEHHVACTTVDEPLPPPNVHIRRRLRSASDWRKEGYDIPV